MINNKKDIVKTPLDEPLSPSINEDGWYTQCIRCWNEVTPKNTVCPNCNQLLDWSWLNKG